MTKINFTLVYSVVSMEWVGLFDDVVNFEARVIADLKPSDGHTRRAAAFLVQGCLILRADGSTIIPIIPDTADLTDYAYYTIDRGLGIFVEDRQACFDAVHEAAQKHWASGDVALEDLYQSAE